MLTLKKIGFNTFWWEDLRTEKKIKDCVSALKKIGYSSVEFKLDSFNQTKDWGNEFTRAVKITKQEGLKVSDFVILRNLCDNDESQRKKAIQDVIKAIYAVAKAGTPLLNTISGSAKLTRQINPEEWYRPEVDDVSSAWNNFLHSMETILPVAEKEGVTIALEPCIGQLVHNYYTAQEMFRRIDAPQLCLTFDPSHFLLYRNDIPASVKSFGNKIKHIHIKDAVGKPGELGRDFIFPILGEGGIDFPSFFEALNDIGYNGFASVEFESFKYMNDVLCNNPIRAAEISFNSIKSYLKS